MAGSRKSESQPRDGDRHQDPKQLRTLMYLMQNIESAATIVSDNSTALGVGHGRGGSEFEDHFSPERSQAMRRWISDNSILEEHSDLDFSLHQRRGRLVDKEFIYDTDCDSDTKLEEGQVYFLSLAGSRYFKRKSSAMRNLIFQWPRQNQDAKLKTIFKSHVETKT
jgi:hypothetical protein